MVDEEFLSVKEFATLVKAHPNTIRRAIKEKRLSAFKLGGGKRSVYRISTAEISRLVRFDLEEWINRRVEKRLREKT